MRPTSGWESPPRRRATGISHASRRLRPEQVVVDLVYHPLRTAWLLAADEVGARTVDGLGMLIHQAALQQERWLGARPDVGVMRAAAEAALAGR
jgi:shikimate 5-dehydrogenase